MVSLLAKSEVVASEALLYVGFWTSFGCVDAQIEEFGSVVKWVKRCATSGLRRSTTFLGVRLSNFGLLVLCAGPPCPSYMMTWCLTKKKIKGKYSHIWKPFMDIGGGTHKKSTRSVFSDASVGVEVCEGLRVLPKYICQHIEEQSKYLIKHKAMKLRTFIVWIWKVDSPRSLKKFSLNLIK